MDSTEPAISVAAAPRQVSAGGCFGFAVHSPVPLHYVRAGGEEVLELRESTVSETEPGELIFEWKPTPSHPLHARLFRDGSHYRFWSAGIGSILIDPQRFSITLPSGRDPILREERLWSWPTIICMLQRGDLPMHAAAADIDGAAVLLGAPGRFGKSTLATAFHLAGHRALSEDLSCVRWTTPAAVLPGPAMLRLRRDVMTHLHLDGARVMRDDPERCTVAVDADRRGTCDPVALRAIVLLRESTEDIRFERVPLHAALPDLWNLSFHLPTPESRASCFSSVVELAGRVPTWNVYRPLNRERLTETVDRIIAECLR